MNKQKSWVNPFQRKVDHTKKKKSEINNNNENTNNNGKNHTTQGRSIGAVNAWKNVQSTLNYPTALKSCLKINDKSKGGKCGIYSIVVVFSFPFLSS